MVLWLQELATPPSPTDPDTSLGERVFRRVMPPNWWTLSVGAQTQARRVMAETGLCLAWVPRADIVRAIVGAKNKGERDDVLLEHADTIIEDVEAALCQAIHPELGEHPSVAFEAVSAFRGGFPRASQALCAAAVGALLCDHFGESNFAMCRQLLAATNPEQAGLRDFRRVSIQWAIRFAILRSDMEPPPEGFNRHLTAHGVESNFTKAHAIAALMLFAGALRELHELYAVGDAAAVIGVAAHGM